MKSKYLAIVASMLLANTASAQGAAEQEYITRIQQLEIELAELKQGQNSMKVSIGKPTACENVDIPTTPVGDSWSIDIPSYYGYGGGNYNFWRLNCSGTNALVVTFTPLDSNSGSFFCATEISIIENGRQGDTFWMTNGGDSCGTFYVPNSVIIYDYEDVIDIDNALTIKIKGLALFSNYTVNIPVASGTTPTTPTAPSNSLSTTSGLWFDRSLAGLGFNFIQTASGLTPYYYGYDASGLPLWLVGTDGALSYVEVGKTYTISMNEPTDGNGADFHTKPTTANSGTSYWGTLSITFDSCSSATGTLVGIDGIKIFDLSKLAANIGLDCSVN